MKFWTSHILQKKCREEVYIQVTRPKPHRRQKTRTYLQQGHIHTSFNAQESNQCSCKGQSLSLNLSGKLFHLILNLKARSPLYSNEWNGKQCSTKRQGTSPGKRFMLLYIFIMKNQQWIPKGNAGYGLLQDTNTKMRLECDGQAPNQSKGRRPEYTFITDKFSALMMHKNQD